MSKKFQYECESVDLTEDEDDGEEDSRDYVAESQKFSRSLSIRCNIPNLNQSPLPPLIPIPRISAPKTSNGASSVPTLTKIQSQGEAPKVADSLANTRDFGRNVTLVESPHSNVTSISTTQIPSTPGGKVILIKKNNKLYKIVIPHNVMPSSDSGGPVVINIPEVGPLVIKIDPQAKIQSAAKPAPIIEPFSLNFDDIIEKASMGEAVEEPFVAKSACTSTEKVFSVSQKLFPCWTAPAARTTRTKITFNGFSKRELANSKRCHNQLNHVIVKYRRKFEAYKHARQYKASQNKTDTNSLKPNTGNYKDFDSLLMTKKVVMLNGDEEMNEINSFKKSTRGKPVWRRRKRPSYEKLNLQPVVCIPRWESLESQYKHLIKPCFVGMKRMNELEEMLKNDRNIALKPFKNYQSLLRLSLMGAKAPNSISNQSTATLEERRELYQSRLIKDVRTFNTLMAFIKPVLVMNEYNYSIVNIKTEFCKANLVYPVGQDRHFPDNILACTDFRNAVANDYIKLVDSELLCRYFKGEIGPGATMA